MSILPVKSIGMHCRQISGARSTGHTCLGSRPARSRGTLSLLTFATSGIETMGMASSSSSESSGTIGININGRFEA